MTKPSHQLICPVCQAALAQTQNEALICNSGHGLLLTGKMLHEGLSIQSDVPPQSSQQNITKPLQCPNCSNEMVKTDYDSKGVIIDSCPSCPYRWLDAGELTKIGQHSSELSADQLLFLHSIESSTKHSDDDVDYSLPGTTTYRTGLTRNPLAGLLAMATSGAIFGLVRSKQTRMFVLVSLAVIVGAVLIVVLSF